MKKINLLLLVLLLTMFSMFFQGYRVFTGDHIIFMPEIMNSQDPNLFQDDLLVNFKLTNYTYFDELITYSMEFFNINIFYAMFFLTFIFKLIYFYAIYKIAYYFTKDEHFSVFSMILFAHGFLVYGTTSHVLDNLLVPRLISISVCLLFLVLYLNRKRFLSTLSLGFGIVMHSPSSLPFLAFFYLDLIFYKSKRYLKRILLGTVPFLFLIFLTFNRKSFNLGLFRMIDPVWEAVIKFRSTTNFITTWTFFHFLFLIASVCLLIVCWVELKKILKNSTKRTYFYLLTIIPAVFFIASFVFVDLLNIHFFTQFGLTRSLLFWKIFITLFFSYFAYQHIKTNPKDFTYNFSLIGIIASFIFNEVLVFVFLPMFLFLWLKRKYDFIDKEWASYLLFAVCCFVVVMYVSLAKEISYILTPLVGIAFLFTSIVSILVYFKEDLVFGSKSKYIFIILLLISVIYLALGFSIYPDYFENEPLMEACDWIKENTDEQSMFLTEPFTEYSGAVRLTCEKKIFTTLKEGGKVSPERESALEWKKRYDMVVEVEKDINFISDIREEYDIDYIFSDYELDVNYPLVFNNSEHYIYQLS